jgi:hypothetical protein
LLILPRRGKDGDSFCGFTDKKAALRHFKKKVVLIPFHLFL